MLHLSLAALWLGVGAVLLIVRPPWAERSIVPLHWFALVLAAYNLVRWWSLRQLARGLRQSEERWEKARESRRRLKEDMSNPDPNLQFSNPPPPEPRP
jgi:hypothetical protein